MKTLLVPFFDDDAAQNALDYAATIAKRFNSHIEGLFVVRPPQVIDGEGMAMMASYVTQLEEEGERLAVRAFKTVQGDRGDVRACRPGGHEFGSGRQHQQQ